MMSGIQQAATADTGSAADKAYDLTRRAILDLTFSPGSTLSEALLVAQIGASRTPIRQALQRLEHEGLVRVFPQRGTVVAPLDLQGFRLQPPKRRPRPNVRMSRSSPMRSMRSVVPSATAKTRIFSA
jgi:DNA-binding FadR family transcriptional regulator